MRWHGISNSCVKFSVFKLSIKQLLKKPKLICADFFLFLLTNMFTLLQLRESFKDLKKKFNNLKFNYTKKTEKARNMKALKIQIQQVDTYAEKLQVIEILGLVKASPVKLLGLCQTYHRRLAHHKIYCALPSYSSLYTSHLSLTETFFTVLFLLFFHLLQ